MFPILTFSGLFEFMYLIYNIQVPEAPLLIVGTKGDLRNDPEVQAKLGQCISVEDGHNLAKQLGAKCYVECSALTQEGLKNVFDEAIRAAMNKDKKKKNKCVCL